MRVLFDITHPVNVHFFKNVIAMLRADGHEVVAAAREKDIAVELLKAEGIPYFHCGGVRPGLTGLAIELVLRDIELFRAVRRIKPDLMVAAEAGPWIGHVGTLLGIPRIVFDQVDNAPIQQWLGLPFASVICTGTGYRGDWGRKHRRFKGFLAQAYLSPPYFVPDPEKIRLAGVDPEDPYVVVRLVSWGANHDIGKAGMDATGLRRLIDGVSRHARVFLSSETPLPDDLAEYRLPVPAQEFHHLLAFADLCITEGGTLPVEAAVLGVPVISCESYDFGYLNALRDRYGLVTQAADLDDVLAKAQKCLADKETKFRQTEAAARLRSESEDVSRFMRLVITDWSA